MAQTIQTMNFWARCRTRLYLCQRYKKESLGLSPGIWHYNCSKPDMQIFSLQCEYWMMLLSKSTMPDVLSKL